jgi:hypothetical protein
MSVTATACHKGNSRLHLRHCAVLLEARHAEIGNLQRADVEDSNTRGRTDCKTASQCAHLALPVFVDEDVERFEVAVDQRRAVRVHIHETCTAEADQAQTASAAATRCGQAHEVTRSDVDRDAEALGPRERVVLVVDDVEKAAALHDLRDDAQVRLLKAASRGQRAQGQSPVQHTATASTFCSQTRVHRRQDAVSAHQTPRNSVSDGCRSRRMISASWQNSSTISGGTFRVSIFLTATALPLQCACVQERQP